MTPELWAAIWDLKMGILLGIMILGGLLLIVIRQNDLLMQVQQNGHTRDDHGQQRDRVRDHEVKDLS